MYDIRSLIDEHQRAQPATIFVPRGCAHERKRPYFNPSRGAATESHGFPPPKKLAQIHLDVSAREPKPANGNLVEPILVAGEADGT